MSSASPFNEQFKSKHVHPACGQTGAVEFPYDEVYARLDGDRELKNDLVVDGEPIQQHLKFMLPGL